MKKKLKLFTELPGFVRDCNQKDRIQERLLLKARQKTSDQLKRFMNAVQENVSTFYPLLNQDNLDPRTVAHMKRMEYNLEQSAHHIAADIRTAWHVMQSQNWLFAYAATQKAMLNAGHPGKPDPRGWKPIPTTKTSLGSTADRVHLSLERLKRKVIDAVQMSRILKDTPAEAVERALAIFPRPKKVKRMQVLTRVLREAYRKDPEEDGDPITGPQFIDGQEWQDIVDEYKDAYIPAWRDPRYTLEEQTPDEGGAVVYPWQVENEMTEDFVDKVRAGENEGANAQGITDFVWVAILDSHTDDCCVWRDGLTSTEIEEMLDGERADDECRATAAPAHFNCRCRNVPATDELPDKPADNSQDIEEWLAA